MGMGVVKSDTIGLDQYDARRLLLRAMGFI